MNKTLIITCGGTFSKIYNPINGTLVIPKNNNNLKSLLKKFLKLNTNLVEIKSFIYKDSLDMNEKDRKGLKKIIENTKFSKIIVIHGTDTIHLSAKEIEETTMNNNICVVFVGAMEPISIDPIEGCINLGCAYGFLQANHQKGTFISMNGLIKKASEITKNKELGYFECLK